ncbi:DUF488 family protein [Clostridium ganghwense]|uniref:DUF488 domain-containing protein n=1 Tax=Clostridium ganghwense TaxID=312089 RepID=A0ABT4CM49_9CLOT|nr:DUF488 domain-containing protein [Clostridium ganghwense]MCY6370008.1 DUF488 domain-containing protein [Clostridium ganghwense]
MVCYTIGHSTRSLDEFIDIVKEYKIHCIVDVRNVPYAAPKYTEVFNRKFLEARLKDDGINYICCSKELGARRMEQGIIDKEKNIFFDKVIECDLFKKGIHKVIELIKKGERIAIMCSERNPLNCHRSILIGYILSKKGFCIEHIIDENNTKSQSWIEEELFITYEPILKSKLVEISLQDILHSVKYDDISEKEVKKKIIEQGYRMKWREINKNYN